MTCLEEARSSRLLHARPPSFNLLSNIVSFIDQVEDIRGVRFDTKFSAIRILGPQDWKNGGVSGRLFIGLIILALKGVNLALTVLLTLIVRHSLEGQTSSEQCSGSEKHKRLSPLQQLP